MRSPLEKCRHRVLQIINVNTGTNKRRQNKKRRNENKGKKGSKRRRQAQRKTPLSCYLKLVAVFKLPAINKKMITTTAVIIINK